MRLLLDTQIMLWQISDDKRLSGRLRDCLIDPDNVKIVSDVSSWEVVIKNRTGKLDISLEAFEAEVRYNEYERLPIVRSHFARLLKVPIIHRDPFDHLLIAQAQVEKLSVLTADRKFKDYAVTLAVT